MSSLVRSIANLEEVIERLTDQHAMDLGGLDSMRKQLATVDADRATWQQRATSAEQRAKHAERWVARLIGLLGPSTKHLRRHHEQIGIAACDIITRAEQVLAELEQEWKERGGE